MLTLLTITRKRVNYELHCATHLYHPGGRLHYVQYGFSGLAWETVYV
jgi:hypothetical protein